MVLRGMQDPGWKYARSARPVRRGHREDFGAPGRAAHPHSRRTAGALKDCTIGRDRQDTKTPAKEQREFGPSQPSWRLGDQLSFFQRPASESKLRCRGASGTTKDVRAASAKCVQPRPSRALYSQQCAPVKFRIASTCTKTDRAVEKSLLSLARSWRGRSVGEAHAPGRARARTEGPHVRLSDLVDGGFYPHRFWQRRLRHASQHDGGLRSSFKRCRKR
jgi:hypothetical protein